MSDPAGELCRLLTARFGWHLEHDRGEIERLLASRCRGRDTEGQYVAALASAPQDAPEFRAIAEALAVSETYFFRNPEQFEVLAEVALPAIAAHTSQPIRLLSAGAASGEEAYSAAMTVLQYRKRHPLPPVEIVGLDVSRRAVQRARRGEYSPWALRALPPALKDAYFVPEGRHFRIRNDVSSLVRFEEANLLHVAAAAPGPWDIVFLRNTFMYFTVEAARALFDQIAAMTPPQSFLFLGHAETLRGISDAFALRHSHQTFYYQREPAGRQPLAALPGLSPLPAAAAPSAAHGSDAMDDTVWFREIAQASARIAALVDGRPTTSDAGPAPAGSVPPAPPLTAALTLLAQERHDAALAVLGAAIDPERLLLRAVLLVNMGRTADARAAAGAVLSGGGDRAGAHYVLALCAERARDDAAAVRHDELAILADDTFAMPHLHLALIARRRRDDAAARRHAARAHRLFASEDDLRILAFGGGFSRQALLQLCDAQLEPRAS